METVDEPDDPVLPPQPFIQMPNALHAIPVTWTGVRIEWEEPAREYCELKQYKVKVEGGVDGSSPTEHVIECPPQPCSVGIYTGLVRGGSYQCSVCAVPDQGNESSYSTKLSFTLPTIEPPVLDAQLVETPEEGMRPQVRLKWADVQPEGCALSRYHTQLKVGHGEWSDVDEPSRLPATPAMRVPMELTPLGAKCSVRVRSIAEPFGDMAGDDDLASMWSEEVELQVPEKLIQEDSLPPPEPRFVHAPTDVEARPELSSLGADGLLGPTALRLTWTTPEVAIGCVITSYDVHVRCEDGGGEWTERCTGPEARVDGLDRGSIYVCTVTARAETAEGEAVVDCKPSAPCIVTLPAMRAPAAPVVKAQKDGKEMLIQWNLPSIEPSSADAAAADELFGAVELFEVQQSTDGGMSWNPTREASSSLRTPSDCKALVAADASSGSYLFRVRAKAAMLPADSAPWSEPGGLVQAAPPHLHMILEGLAAWRATWTEALPPVLEPGQSFELLDYELEWREFSNIGNWRGAGQLLLRSRDDAADWRRETGPFHSDKKKGIGRKSLYSHLLTPRGAPATVPVGTVLVCRVRSVGRVVGGAAGNGGSNATHSAWATKILRFPHVPVPLEPSLEIISTPKDGTVASSGKDENMLSLRWGGEEDEGLEYEVSVKPQADAGREPSSIDDVAEGGLLQRTAKKSMLVPPSDCPLEPGRTYAMRVRTHWTLTPEQVSKLEVTAVGAAFDATDAPSLSPDLAPLTSDWSPAVFGTVPEQIVVPDPVLTIGRLRVLEVLSTKKLRVAWQAVISLPGEEPTAAHSEQLAQQSFELTARLQLAAAAASGVNAGTTKWRAFGMRLRPDDPVGLAATREGLNYESYIDLRQRGDQVVAGDDRGVAGEQLVLRAALERESGGEDGLEAGHEAWSGPVTWDPPEREEVVYVMPSLPPPAGITVELVKSGVGASLSKWIARVRCEASMEATLREEASGSARMDRRLSQYRVAWVTMPNGSEQSLMMEVGASFLELPELRPGDTYNVLAYAVYTFAPAAGAGMEAVEESAASSPCEVTVPLLSEPTDMTLLEHLGHAAKLSWNPPNNVVPSSASVERYELEFSTDGHSFTRWPGQGPGLQTTIWTGDLAQAFKDIKLKGKLKGKPKQLKFRVRAFGSVILDGHQYELMSSPAVLVKGVDLAPSVLLQPKLKFETLKYASGKSEALKLSISLDDVGDGRRVIGYQLEHKRLKRPPPPTVDESGEAVVLEKVMSREEEKAEFARRPWERSVATPDNMQLSTLIYPGGGSKPAPRGKATDGLAKAEYKLSALPPPARLVLSTLDVGGLCAVSEGVLTVNGEKRLGTGPVLNLNDEVIKDRGPGVIESVDEPTEKLKDKPAEKLKDKPVVGKTKIRMGSEAEGLAESWQVPGLPPPDPPDARPQHTMERKHVGKQDTYKEHLSGCTFLFRVRAQLESGEVRCWSEWREERHEVETMHDAKVKSMGGGFRFIDEQHNKQLEAMSEKEREEHEAKYIRDLEGGKLYNLKGRAAQRQMEQMAQAIEERSKAKRAQSGGAGAMTTAQLARMEEQQRKRAAEEEEKRKQSDPNRKKKNRKKKSPPSNEDDTYPRAPPALSDTEDSGDEESVRSMSGDGALTEEQAPPPPSKLDVLRSLFRRGASVAPEPKYSE